MSQVREALLKTNGNFQFFHSRSGGELQHQASHLQAAVDLDDAIKTESNPSPEPRSIAENITSNDNLLYIYTSGTTGLPKAVIIKHIRFGIIHHSYMHPSIIIISLQFFFSKGRVFVRLKLF